MTYLIYEIHCDINLNASMRIKTFLNFFLVSAVWHHLVIGAIYTALVYLLYLVETDSNNYHARLVISPHYDNGSLLLPAPAVYILHINLCPTCL